MSRLFFLIFYHYWGTENCSLYQGLRIYRGFTAYQRSVYVRKSVTNKCCLIIECENCVLICLGMHYLDLLIVLWKRAAGRPLKL